jgi:toxin ParE1/3/4
LKRPHGTNDSAPVLVQTFFEAFEAAVDLVEEQHIPLSPYPGKAGAAGAQRIILKRFPYDIVIVEHAAELVVIAVAHQSRKPGYWRERLSP